MRDTSGWMDDYYKGRNSITDLSWIGQQNNTKEEEDNMFCPDCNIKLIEKKDDMAHLNYSYNRYICSRCGIIIDPRYDSPGDIKHAETLHTLTDEGTNSTQAHVEVLTVDDEIKTGIRHDILEDIDSNELSDLRYGSGLIVGKFSSVTKSSVNGRTVIRNIENEE